MLRSSLLKPRHVLKKKKNQKKPHSSTLWSFIFQLGLQIPARTAALGRPCGRVQGGEQLLEGHPEMGATRISQLPRGCTAPFRLYRPSAPFLILLPGGWGPPSLPPRPCLRCCPPRGCRRGLDEAPESWQHRRGRLAPQGIACAGNAAPRRHYRSEAAKTSRERLLTPGFVMLRSELVFFLFRTFDARLFVELLAAGC